MFVISKITTNFAVSYYKTQCLTGATPQSFATMKRYIIEFNGKYIQEYKSKKSAFKWIESYLEKTKPYVDFDEYPACIRIWECSDKHRDCIWSNCEYDN